MISLKHNMHEIYRFSLLCMKSQTKRLLNYTSLESNNLDEGCILHTPCIPFVHA